MAVTRGNKMADAVIMMKMIAPKEFPRTRSEEPKIKVGGVQRAATQILTKLSIFQLRWSWGTGAKWSFAAVLISSKCPRENFTYALVNMSQLVL